MFLETYIHIYIYIYIQYSISRKGFHKRGEDLIIDVKELKKNLKDLKRNEKILYIASMGMDNIYIYNDNCILCAVDKNYSNL